MTNNFSRRFIARSGTLTRKRKERCDGRKLCTRISTTCFYVCERLHLAEAVPIRVEHFMKTSSNAITDLGWSVSFWFTVVTPALGLLTGFLALFLFSRRKS